MRRADSSGADHPVPARSRVQRFAPAMVAAMAIGAAVVVRLALEPILRGTQAWLTFWPAVFAAAWFGGWRAGIASIVATLSILMVWDGPSTSLTTPSAIAGGFVFVLCGSAFCYLAHAVRRVHDLERRLRRGYLRFATALSNASTPEQVARALVEEGAQALSADVSVFAHVIDHDRLEVIAHRGIEVSLSPGQRFPIGAKGPLGYVLRTGQEYLVETADEFRALFTDLALDQDPATRATAALPLIVGDRVVGAMALRFKHERRFSPEERDLLRTLAAQSAQAFERAAVLDKERAAAQRTQALVELAAVLASAQSVAEVGQAVVREGSRASRADTSMLYVVEESRFRLAAECGCAPEVVEKVREILLDSEHGRRLLSEQWLEGTDDYRTTMPDVASIPSSHRRALSAWSIPLVIEAKVVGVLAMGFYEARQFREDEREFARLFAQHCAQAVARAERSARLDRERLRLARIFDTNLIGTVFWEDRSRVVRANHSFLRMVGYSEEDLAARRLDLDTLTPAEFADADRAAADALEATGKHEAYEKEYAHRAGHRVPVLVSSAAFFDDPHRGVAFIADLTQVKHAAEAANRAKDQFLAMLGHELRNPLAAMTTAVDLMRLRNVVGADREVGILSRQLAQLTRMVDDLLDVSRIRNGKIELVRQPIELAELVGRALETVAPILETRRHRLAVDVPRSGMAVHVDATRMGQVLANVLTNAAKYTDPGGDIRIGARIDDGCAVVEIVDNGVGIDAQLLPRVFEPFTQEVQSVARSRGGLGLGLAIARTFVQLHGGEISVHSKGKGTGTHVRVRLPLAASDRVRARA